MCTLRAYRNLGLRTLDFESSFRGSRPIRFGMETEPGLRMSEATCPKTETNNVPCQPPNSVCPYTGIHTYSSPMYVALQGLLKGSFCAAAGQGEGCKRPRAGVGVVPLSSLLSDCFYYYFFLNVFLPKPYKP